MPCTDGANAINGKVKQEVVDTSHQQDHPKTDACSPFCSCSCCASVSLVHPIAKEHSIPPIIKKSYSSFYSSSIKGNSLAIWQPPKLA